MASISAEVRVAIETFCIGMLRQNQRAGYLFGMAGSGRLVADFPAWLQAATAQTVRRDKLGGLGY